MPVWCPGEPDSALALTLLPCSGLLFAGLLSRCVLSRCWLPHGHHVLLRTTGFRSSERPPSSGWIRTPSSSERPYCRRNHLRPVPSSGRIWELPLTELKAPICNADKKPFSRLLVQGKGQSTLTKSELEIVSKWNNVLKLPVACRNCWWARRHSQDLVHSSRKFWNCS